MCKTVLNGRAGLESNFPNYQCSPPSCHLYAAWKNKSFSVTLLLLHSAFLCSPKGLRTIQGLITPMILSFHLLNYIFKKVTDTKFLYNY